MVLVEVIELPVRYRGVTYYKGETFQVETPHVMPNVMRLVGEVAKDQTDFSYGAPVVLGEGELNQMSVDGLKDYAKEFKISLGRSSSKEGIIEKIVKAQKNEG